jgi:histidinol-phosphatase (PHP family)
MYDYHNHSSFSYDGNEPIDAVLKGAVDAGLKGIALTDHFDPDYPGYEAAIDLSTYWAELTTAAHRHAGQIIVAKGLEIGLQPGSVMEQCKAAAGACPWDFILASVHVVGGQAIDEAPFSQGRSPDHMLALYYRELFDCIEHFENFDVLSHLNIVDRYVDRDQIGRGHMDLVEAVLKKTVAMGKGIEINTSCWRYGMGERTTPTQEMLDLYVHLGGEIITTGSDAHRSRDVGYRIERAHDMIKKAGLSYVTSYEGRQPIFHKI